MTSVLRKGLSMQDLACCDYFRIPAKFQGVDIFVFIGDIFSIASAIKFQ
jgi:hypothetical protein